MGKAFKHRQSELEIANEKNKAWLAKNTKRILADQRSQKFAQENRMYQIIKRFESDTVRDIRSWKKSGKTKNNDKILLSMVRHCFAKYKVPEFLEHSWIKKDYKDTPLYIADVAAGSIDFRKWYICIGNGKSLYKEYGRHLKLSRMDIHNFLNFPYQTNDPNTALWYGIAISQGASIKIATMIWRSKISQKDIKNEFWKSVTNWFIHNPPESVAQMNDLLDYIAHRHTEGGNNFSMKGRTLESLLKGMTNWHYELRRMKNIGGGSWEGMPIYDSDITVGEDEEKQIWHFVQIKNGDRLAKEGTNMHHCVWSYKHYCMQGTTFIWAVSMTRQNKTKDYLTIEIILRDNRYQIVQVRGFANRVPNKHESNMVSTWAQKEGITVRGFY